MIKPHGSDILLPRIVEDGSSRKEILEASKNMKSIKICSAAASNLVMLGAGYFTPLEGFMDKEDILSVANNMKIKNDLFWPTPVMNLVKEDPGISVGEEVILIDPNMSNENVIAVQKINNVEQLRPNEVDLIVEKTFGTKDPEHPGVKTMYEQGNYLISGPVEGLNYSYFEELFR